MRVSFLSTHWCHVNWDLFRIHKLGSQRTNEWFEMAAPRKPLRKLFEAGGIAMLAAHSPQSHGSFP